MDCVEWDGKGYGIIYEQFIKGVEGARDDMLWFHSHIGELRKMHLGKWIGVRDKKIVASDRDHDASLARLRKRDDLARIRIFLVTPEKYVGTF